MRRTGRARRAATFPPAACADEPRFPDCSERFLRLDVEGFERAVLCGAAGTLEQLRPVLMVEVMERGDEVLALLPVHGCEAFTRALRRSTSAPGGCLPAQLRPHLEWIRLFTC
jgi:hypothetical protein